MILHSAKKSFWTRPIKPSYSVRLYTAGVFAVILFFKATWQFSFPIILLGALIAVYLRLSRDKDSI